MTDEEQGTNWSTRLLAITRASGRALRDLWLVLGVTLVLVIALESLYRFQGAARSALRGPAESPAADAPTFPLDTLAWFPQYREDHLKEEAVEWAPYLYLRNPTFDGPTISVDSAGHRVTPQPSPEATEVVELYFMGGSTTFGWFQRAPYTIPAIAARELSGGMPSGVRLEVTNFGVPGRTSTQELLALVLELQRGARPEVVVFYDGINDVMATVQNGIAGLPQNEANRVADFERGVRVREAGVANRLQDLGGVLLSTAMALELVQRIVPAHSVANVPSISPQDASTSLLHVYASNVQITEALAAQYGFTPLYVWQPALLSTSKPLTPFEQRLVRRVDDFPDLSLIRDLHVAMPELLRDSIPSMVGNRFIDATRVFDQDSTEIFADIYGHTYEPPNEVIVRELLPILSALIAEAVPQPVPEAR